MYKEKPVIGLMPLYDEDKESYWMLPGYMQGLEKYGAIPLMLPLTDDYEELDYFIETCDGFLFTGGHDIDPSLYYQERKETCGISIFKRDKMEAYIFKKAVFNNKVILGICRGIQMINVMCGGTLYQDLPTEYESAIDHHIHPPYDQIVHGVYLKGPLHDLLECSYISVNSYHHQAICELGNDLQVMATSEDGLIEGIYLPQCDFVWGIQWHPEFSYQNNEASQKILEAFVKACQERGKKDEIIEK